MTAETWRPVVGYEDVYEVSSHGQVRRTTGIPGYSAGRVLRPRVGVRGYPSVNLHRSKRGRSVDVHILVCEAFHGLRPPGMQVRHLDGNSLNNHIDNLAWGTASENNFDTVRHGQNWNANKTHCKHGHEFTPENTYRNFRGHRNCKTCVADCSRRRWLARSERAA